MKASTLTLPDTEGKLDAFLQFNEREVLSRDCELRADAAKTMVLQRYESFDDARCEAARLAAGAEDLSAERQLKGKGRRKEN